MTSEQDALPALQEAKLDLARDSLSEQIYNHLRLKLITGLYPQGSRLSIRRLASELKTSPTPVREAVFQLVREGALELRSGYQPRVPMLDIQTYLQIRETRVPLERLAGELAAAHITPEELAALRDHHRKFIEAEAAEEWQAALIANQNFHFGIYTAARNPVLLRVIGNLWLLVGPFVSAQYPHIREAASDVHPHLLIIDALDRRAPAEAGDMVVSDLREGSYRILRQLEAEAQKPRRKAAASRSR